MRAILAIVLFTSIVYLGLLNRETTRKVAVILLIVAFVTPSIFSVSFGYPFGQVGLFGNAGPTEITEYEVLVVDEDGTRLQYDARAVSPLTDDYLRAGYVPKMLANDAYARTFGPFLIDRANAYRRGQGGDWSVLEPARFPRHQLDAKWSRAERRSLNRVVRVEVVRIDASISADGMHRETNREVVLTVIENGTVTNETD